MKFFRFCLLLAVCITVFSCRETLGERHRNSPKEQAVPSSDKKEIQKTLRDSINSYKSKPMVPKPGPKKKVKKQDTLKPRRAIP